MSVAPDHSKKTPRCPACQLQLCKARGELPHAALTQVSRDETTHNATLYKCGTCGAVLTCSQDRSAPGWAHKR